MSTSVDVCVATYKRPLLLGQLLLSLSAQRLPQGVSVRVIVVDNDSRGSALKSVSSFAAKNAGLPVTYVAEPAQGISFARNRALSLASAEWLAFIDDDERADPEWIARLLAAANRYSAEVVFGPVRAILPAGCPGWVRAGRFFERPRYATGTPLPFGATNNALLKSDVVRRFDARFSVEYAHSGGEDTDFFASLGRNGVRMIWCDEAAVSEEVPPERATLHWLLKRHFRSGQAFARIFVPRLGWPGKLHWAVKRSIILLAAACALPPLWLLRRDWGIKALLAMVRNGGQLTGLSRFRYFEYR